jgi:hypothetical protein
VGIALPSLVSGGTSLYTNSSAITAFLSTFNQTVQALMSYPELLMWCAARTRRARAGAACAPLRADAALTWRGTRVALSQDDWQRDLAWLGLGPAAVHHGHGHLERQQLPGVREAPAARGNATYET